MPENFYIRLHDEFFDYVKDSGQVNCCWGRLRIDSGGTGIEIYDIREPDILSFDSLFEGK